VLRVALVLRSTEVHPEFCGLSSPFTTSILLRFATGVICCVVICDLVSVTTATVSPDSFLTYCTLLLDFYFMSLVTRSGAKC
jgi:hypothetical protein